RHTRSKRDWSSDVCSSDLDRGDLDGELPDEHAGQQCPHDRPEAEATDLEAPDGEAQREGEKDGQLGVVPQRGHEPVHGLTLAFRGVVSRLVVEAGPVHVAGAPAFVTLPSPAFLATVTVLPVASW